MGRADSSASAPVVPWKTIWSVAVAEVDRQRGAPPRGRQLGARASPPAGASAPSRTWTTVRRSTSTLRHVRRADPGARDPAGRRRTSWICPEPERPHPGDRGTDAAGRRRYLYHPRLAPASRPPEVRRDGARVRAGAAGAARGAPPATCAGAGSSASGCWPAQCASSTAGSSGSATEGYAAENGSYGLATMQRRHVTARAGRGRPLRLPLQGREAARPIRRRLSRSSRSSRRSSVGGPGPVARATDSGSHRSNVHLGRHQPVHQGGHARHVHGQGLPHVERRPCSLPSRSRSRARRIARRPRAREQSPARCRRWPTTSATRRPSAAPPTIDPRVFDRFRDGLTIGGALAELGKGDRGEPATQGAVEEAVLDLLERDVDSSDARARSASAAR